MKVCPTCQTTFDDFTNFCLRDGTPLVAAPAANSVSDEPATVVTSNLPEAREPARVEPIRVDIAQPPPVAAAPPVARITPPTVVPVETESPSNTGRTVLLTVLGTLLVLGLAGLGLLMWQRGNSDQRAATNTRPANGSQVSPNRNAAAANANAGNANLAVNSAVVVANSSTVNSANSANAANAASNANRTNANAAATPAPTVDPARARQVRTEVEDVLDGWKDSTEDRDIDEHAGYYADTLDYYNARGASSERVRNDRERAFSTYNIHVKVNLSNVRIVPDASGERAVAVFDKSWDFEGDDARISTGKVQQQLTLAKINGRWRITGEKDLKNYKLPEDSADNRY